MSGKDDWRTFSRETPDPRRFIWLVESPAHVPNENRVPLWAETRADVDRVAKIVDAADGQVLQLPELCRETTRTTTPFLPGSMRQSLGNLLPQCE